ncbi:DUF2868 domain-containing protein [Aliidiomarina indica]|uniref:DUF2868 domain-containing protein n=1 Tax=Aliidiomarina indica TaxID=2749147 RepID=UPI00188EB48B|nr:DUF2868 domain-containing protein [Aliidiomarina indica]
MQQFDSMRNALTTEVMRLHELRAHERGEPAIDDHDAVAQAQQHDELHQQIDERARILADPLGYPVLIARMFASLRMVAAIMVLFMFLAGVGLAGRLLAGSSINLFTLIILMIGLNWLMLLIWLIAAARQIYRGSNEAAGVGSWLFHIGSWLKRDKPIAIVIEGFIHTLIYGRMSFAYFSRFTHGLWFVFSLGTLLCTYVLLISKGYSFHWETTILSSDVQRALLGIFAWMPELLGVSRPVFVEGVAITDRQSIGIWLLAVIALYSVLPRFLLWWGSALLLRARVKKLQTDPQRVGLSHLAQRLRQRATVVVDPAPDHIAHPVAGRQAQFESVDAVVSLDHATAADKLQQHDNYWGVIDSVETKRQFLGHITGIGAKHVCIRVDSAISPDRGSLRTLTDIANATSIHVALVLQNRAPERIEAWREALRESNIPFEEVSDE